MITRKGPQDARRREVEANECTGAHCGDHGPHGSGSCSGACDDTENVQHGKDGRGRGFGHANETEADGNQHGQAEGAV